jgi:hypothetical protein
MNRDAFKGFKGKWPTSGAAETMTYHRATPYQEIPDLTNIWFVAGTSGRHDYERGPEPAAGIPPQLRDSPRIARQLLLLFGATALQHRPGNRGGASENIRHFSIRLESLSAGKSLAVIHLRLLRKKRPAPVTETVAAFLVPRPELASRTVEMVV